MKARDKGHSQLEAARLAKFSVATGKRVEAMYRQEKPRTDRTNERAKAQLTRQTPNPIKLEDLCDEAKRALDDFSYFQRRYFGRIATRWQAMAAERVLTLLESNEKEFCVINAPPGSGKTTLFTHDIPAWLTCRDRAIRGLIGSRTEATARTYTARLRRSFERTIPLEADGRELTLGLALDAETCLCDDFGVFRTGQQLEQWSGSTFIVAQHDGVLIDEKEPTWSCAGYDTGFLGMRYNFVAWDDLVDKKSLRTQEAMANMREWWDDVAEARLEPAGVILLQGQRMGANDLYRYALDKATVVMDEEDEADRKVYHHIVFKAHDITKCDGTRQGHSKNAPYWPDGCLLDPRRLSWSELRKKMGNRNGFAVVYQQEDSDPEDVLVDPLWIDGGTDPRTGMVYPGCKDMQRDICQLPGNLAGDLISYVTVDPSPTKYWAIEWWVTRCVDGEPQERYLMDLHRAYMDAPDFLEWYQATQSFGGIAEEWAQRADNLGFPIRAWIVERNGAQRFLLQYEHVRRWTAKWRTEIWPHDTGINKNDPQFGVQTLSTIFKYGLVRLPWKGGSTISSPSGGGHGYMASAKLVEEVTRWTPENAHGTDDCVMSMWFGELALPKLVPPANKLPKMKTVSWLQGTKTYEWATGWRKAV